MFYNPQDRFTDYEANHSCFFVAALGIVGGLGSIAGSALGFLGQQNATNAQAQGQQNQLLFQQGVYNQEQNNLQPYLYTGAGALNSLYGNIGTPTTPGALTESPAAFGGLPAQAPQYNLPTPTLAQFQQSPGYQWQLGQGVNAIQNAAGPKTGVLGGNTLQALQTYGTGLANQDWYNWLNNYQNNYNTQYQANNQNYWNQYQAAGAQQQNWLSILSSLLSGGQNAAVQQGAGSASLTNAIGNTMSNIGSTRAAGALGSAGAINNAINPSGGGIASGANQIGNALTTYFNSQPTSGNTQDPAALYYGNQDFSGGTPGLGY